MIDNVYDCLLVGVAPKSKEAGWLAYWADLGGVGYGFLVSGEESACGMQGLAVIAVGKDLAYWRE